MKKLFVFAAAAVTLGSAFAVPSNANPLPTGPIGQKCRFNSTTDVTREAGWQIGVISAGPLVTAEDGTLHCSIHVNNNSHSGPALVDETATTVAGVAAVMEPRELHYQATAADTISMCARWDGAGGTLYWRSANTTTDPTDIGGWTSTDEGCGEATSIEPNDPECSIWKAIDSRLGTNIAEIWQDCEPYEEFPLPI